MPQAIGHGPRIDGKTEAVDDILAVRPRLHQPRRREGPQAHGRPVPRQPDRIVLLGEVGERIEHGGARRAPCGEQHEAREVPAEAFGVRRERTQVGQAAVPVGDEPIRINGRLSPGRVEVREVTDLIANPPALRRRRTVPGMIRKGRHHRIERLVLGVEVLEQLRQRVRHGPQCVRTNHEENTYSDG